MGRYVLRRMASAVVTLWVLASIIFLMVNVLPGNVGRQVLGAFASEDDVVRFNHAIGTDRPLISQYLTSIRRVFTLDFGDSYQYSQPVRELMLDRYHLIRMFIRIRNCD
jgi:peptide/nickel transport system permease protein